MQQRPGAVTFEGNPLTLTGEPFAVGRAAPDAVLIGRDLAPVALSHYAGKVAVLVSVPSLDTPVCDTEVRRFNREAAALADDVAVIAVSMDLPFAQQRWCGATGVERVTTLSDHRDASFGRAYGLLIGELRLLARAVLVLDRKQTLRYAQLVREITDEPDYAAALHAVAELT